MTIRDTTYCTIQGWMRTKLQLSGNELLVYAMVYGLSQDGESECCASLAYMCEWTGASKPTVLKCLNSLVEKSMLIKVEKPVAKSIKTISYRAVTLEDWLSRNFTGGKETLPVVGKETLPGAVKNLYGGGKETLPNKKDVVYNYNNIINNNNTACAHANTAPGVSSAAIDGDPPDQTETQPVQEMHNINDDGLSFIIHRFEQSCGTFPAAALERMREYRQSLEVALIIKAIEEAELSGVRNWRYIDKVLGEWQKAGIRTVADRTAAEAARQQARQQAGAAKPDATRQQYTGRQHGISRPPAEAAAAGDWMRDARERPRRLKQKGERHDQKES